MGQRNRLCWGWHWQGGDNDLVTPVGTGAAPSTEQLLLGLLLGQENKKYLHLAALRTSRFCCGLAMSWILPLKGNFQQSSAVLVTGMSLARVGFALGNAQLDLGAAWSQRSEAGEGILAQTGLGALGEPKAQQGFLLGSGILPPSPALELFPGLEVADGTQGSILRGKGSLSCCSLPL